MRTLFVVGTLQEARYAGFDGPRMLHKDNTDFRVFAVQDQEVEQFAGMNFQTIIISSEVHSRRIKNWGQTLARLRVLLRTPENLPTALIEL